MADGPLTFTFDDALTLNAVRVADRWTEELDPEEFGFRAVTDYIDQFQVAQVDANAVAGGNKPLPPSQASEMFDSALAIMREAWALMENPPEAQATPEEPMVLTDRNRRVTLKAEQGMPVSCEINPAWLRQADLGELEQSLLEAFSRLPESRVAAQGGLESLRERHRALAAQLNELRRG